MGVVIDGCGLLVLSEYIDPVLLLDTLPPLAAAAVKREANNTSAEVNTGRLNKILAHSNINNDVID